MRLRLGACQLRVACIFGLLMLAVACTASQEFRIANNTPDTVTLAGCAQEPHLVRAIPPQGKFVFGEDVGQRTLSDDPGFACLLRTSRGRMLCLHLPTDQSGKTSFDVSEAQPTG